MTIFEEGKNAIYSKKKKKKNGMKTIKKPQSTLHQYGKVRQSQIVCALRIYKIRD